MDPMMNQTHRNSISAEQIQKEIDKLDKINKKQEKTVRNLEAKVVQNVNLYFIFQAVILASTTAAASSPSTTCRSWWIPFTLSLLAAITNLLSFSATMSKVLTSRDEIDQNLADLGFMKLYQMTRDELNQVLPGTPLNHQGEEIVRPKAGPVKRWKRRLVVYLSAGLFVGFSAVVIYGCYSILCRAGDRKCVKLC